MSETLRCPLCKSSVPVTASMCGSCHLPIKDVRANQKPVGWQRFKRLVRRTTLFITLAVIVGLGLVVWTQNRDSAPGGSVESRGIRHSELSITSDNGAFDGTLELTNPATVHANVYVTVHVYDGEQEIGALSGDVSLKPESSARVELDSSDRYDEFTDTVVEILPLPASVG